MFEKIGISKSAALLKIESVAANFPKNRWMFYQFTFCYSFARAMVNCLKHVFLFFVCCRFLESTKTLLFEWMNEWRMRLNECGEFGSTVLIKMGQYYTLITSKNSYHRQFSSLSLLFQFELFKVLVIWIGLFLMLWKKSSHRRCSVKKGVHRNFTGKHLCQSLF